MAPVAVLGHCLGVVRGGGENRKRTAIAFALSFTVALMMLAQPVVAGTLTMKVSDSTNDVGRNWAMKVSDPSQYWGDMTSLAQAGYFDMVSTWLSQKGKTYTFGMELAAQLPQEGSALPNGIKVVEWVMWIDSGPWAPGMDPVATLYRISLYYDGSSYSALLLDVSTMVKTPVPFTVDGSELQVEFSADLVGNPAGLWWSPGVRVWWGPVGSTGEWIVDVVSYEYAPGQWGIEIPWPPP